MDLLYVLIIILSFNYMIFKVIKQRQKNTVIAEALELKEKRTAELKTVETREHLTLNQYESSNV